MLSGKNNSFFVTAGGGDRFGDPLNSGRHCHLWARVLESWLLWVSGIFACTFPGVECGEGAVFLPRTSPGLRRWDRAGVTGPVWWDLGGWMQLSERKAVPECFDGTLALGPSSAFLAYFPL